MNTGGFELQLGCSETVMSTAQQTLGTHLIQPGPQQPTPPPENQPNWGGSEQLRATPSLSDSAASLNVIFIDFYLNSFPLLTKPGDGTAFQTICFLPAAVGR